MRSRVAVFCLAMISILWLAGCVKDPEEFGPANPFDPTNLETEGDPFGVQAETGDGNITVTWAAIRGVSIDGYRVYRSTDSLQGHSKISSDLSDTVYTDTSIELGEGYYYRVTAFQGNDESSLSICVPSVPVGLMEGIIVTSPQAGTIWYFGTTQNISWNSAGTSGAVKIEASYNNGGSWTMIFENVVDDGDTTWTVAGETSSSCFVRVTDVDGSPSGTSGAFRIAISSLNMVSLTGGPFQMGSTSSWAYSHEQPVHPVTISAFSIAKYEVTNEEMREVMQWASDNGKVNASSGTVTNSEGDSQELLDLDDSDCEISFSGGTFTVDNGKEEHPCIEVTWYGGQAFCNYLSDMEGLERCIEFSDWSCDFEQGGYRLPTEGEWEYACRSGTTTDYYSGDETQSGCSPIDPNLDAIGWYCGNANDWTREVGGKDPSDWGLYDMSGNVWEWCNDWYKSDYYDESPSQDPTGPTGGSSRVPRGGGWNFGAEGCRSAFRYGSSPDGSDYGLGFRPARR